MTIRHDIRAARREAEARRSYALAECFGGADSREGREASRHASHLMRSARRERFAHEMGS